MNKTNKEETLKKWDSVLSGMGMSEEKKKVDVTICRTTCH